MNETHRNRNEGNPVTDHLTEKLVRLDVAYTQVLTAAVMNPNLPEPYNTQLQQVLDILQGILEAFPLVEVPPRGTKDTDTHSKKV